MIFSLLAIVTVVAGLSALGRLEHHGACQEAVAEAVRKAGGSAVAQAWDLLVRAPLPLLNMFLLGLPSLLLAVQVWLLLLAVQAMSTSCWSPVVSAPQAAVRTMTWSVGYALFAVILLPVVVHATAVSLSVWILSDDLHSAGASGSEHGSGLVLPPSVLLSGAGGAVFTAFLLHRGLLGGALEMLRPVEVTRRFAVSLCSSSNVDVAASRRRDLPDWPTAHAEVVALAAAALLPSLVCPAVAIAGAVGLWAKHAAETQGLLYQCREEHARRLETQGDWSCESQPEGGHGGARGSAMRHEPGPAGRGASYSSGVGIRSTYRSPNSALHLTATASTCLGVVAVMFHVALLALAGLHGRLSQAAVAGGLLVVALVASLGARVGVVGSLCGDGLDPESEIDLGLSVAPPAAAPQGTNRTEKAASDSESEIDGLSMSGVLPVGDSAEGGGGDEVAPRIRGTGLSLLDGLAAFLRGEPTEPMFGPDGFGRRDLPYTSEPDRVEAEAAAQADGVVPRWLVQPSWRSLVSYEQVLLCPENELRQRTLRVRELQKAELAWL